MIRLAGRRFLVDAEACAGTCWNIAVLRQVDDRARGIDEHDSVTIIVEQRPW